MTRGLPPIERPDRVKDLGSVPNLLGLYGKAVAPSPSDLVGIAKKALGRTASSGATGSESTSLPSVAYRVTGARFHAAQLRAYQSLLGFPRTESVPAGFTHVAAFPVAMALMVAPEFPLQLMGMVHLANRVEVARQITATEEFDVIAWAQNLEPHNKGTSVELVAEVHISGQIVWRGTSTYLAKGIFLKGKGAPAAEREEFAAPMPTALWELAASTGRDYAAVSGDRNPIHLSAVTAKALGFPKAIAHGMYTAARALAEAGPLVGESFAWSVEFAKPVLLPGRVSVSITPRGSDESSAEDHGIGSGTGIGSGSGDSDATKSGHDFGSSFYPSEPGQNLVRFLGWNAKRNQLHFTGTISPLTDSTLTR